MTGKKLVLVLAFSGMLATPAAHAQVTIDVAKITCEQFILYKVTDPKYIAIWLSGFYNGKRNNTLIDTQGLEKNVDTVKEYCLKNLSVTVMKAAEVTLGAGK
jgi:hypothetical protein